MPFEPLMIFCWAICASAVFAQSAILPLSEKAESVLRSASGKSFVRERIVMASCREIVAPGLARSWPFVFEPVR